MPINPREGENKEKISKEGRETDIEKLKRRLEEREKELSEMRKEVEKIIEKPKPEVLPEKAVKVFEEERRKLKEVLKPVSEEVMIKPGKAPALLPLKEKKEEVEMDLKKVMAMKKPKQVKTLIHLAFDKGLYHSVAVALRLDDPYILDEFHDTLVDELYNLLVKKGKLKKLK